MSTNPEDEGLKWQVGVWNKMSQVYLREVDRRFIPVVDAVLRHAWLKQGEHVLDLGTGTGAIAVRAAALVGPAGRVLGVDISAEMLALASELQAKLGMGNIEFREGRAEVIPAEDASFDAILASLSLMYVVDRVSAAREVARVLKPGGRLVAAVWAGPEAADIVLFQQTAGSFAPPPPVTGVGPGAMADPKPFIAQLAKAGIEASVQTEVLGFDFESFESAWEVLAGVTTAQLPPQRREEAKTAVRHLMWPQGEGPRHFRNTTQLIVGRSEQHRAQQSLPADGPASRARG